MLCVSQEESGEKVVGCTHEQRRMISTSENDITKSIILYSKNSLKQKKKKMRLVDRATAVGSTNYRKVNQHIIQDCMAEEKQSSASRIA